MKVWLKTFCVTRFTCTHKGLAHVQTTAKGSFYLPTHRCTLPFTNSHLSVSRIKQGKWTYPEKAFPSEHLASRWQEPCAKSKRVVAITFLTKLYAQPNRWHKLSTKNTSIYADAYIIIFISYTQPNWTRRGKKSNGRQTQATSIFKIWRLKRGKEKRVGVARKEVEDRKKEESQSTAHTQTPHKEQQWIVCSIDR